MGIESYRTMILTKAPDSDVVQVLVAEMGFTLEEDQADVHDTFLRFEDDEHIIECAVSDGRPCRISLRFALCQPSSIDAVFLGLLVALTNRLLRYDPDGTSVELCEARNEIQEAREAWRALFGVATARLTPSEALRRFVIGDGPS